MKAPPTLQPRCRWCRSCWLCTQVGPPAAGMGAEAAAATRQRLGGLLRGCTRGAPFTLQRFAELLLAPSRQYSSFVKLVRDLRGR